MFDRNKVYGYSWDYMLKNGFPSDNEKVCVGDTDDILTIEEIRRMFPEQNVLLTKITYDGYDSINTIKTAAVKMYHCDRHRDMRFAERYTDYMYSTYTGDVDRLIAGGLSIVGRD